MLIQRRSSFRRNKFLVDHSPPATPRRQRVPGNARWLAESAPAAGVILFGGNSVPHFRARVAQARLRGDLLPSYWSLSGILIAGEIFIVPFDRAEPEVSIPELNGIQQLRPDDFNDVESFPNIALLEFPGRLEGLPDAIRKLQDDRVSTRLTQALWAWLGYLWGVESASNPAVQGVGLPCAQFVAAAYAACDIELMPGLAAGGACPEVLWNSALWWQETFSPDPGTAGDPTAGPSQPWVRGAFRILQPAAAAKGHRDRMASGKIVPSQDQKSIIDEALDRIEGRPERS